MKNKKIIFGLIFGILVLSIFVYAQSVFNEDPERIGTYKVVIPVNKGWNLLPADQFAYWDIHQDSEPLVSKIKNIFLYLPFQNKYIKTFMGMSQSDLAEAQLNQDVLWLSAEWYYLSDGADMFFTIDKTLPSSTKLKLKSGWNLIAIPPQFVDSSLGWGNCEVEKIYLWNPTSQNWMLWEGTPSKTITEKLIEEADQMVGYGIAIKIKSNCELGKEIEQTSPNVPSFPE